MFCGVYGRRFCLCEVLLRDCIIDGEDLDLGYYCWRLKNGKFGKIYVIWYLWSSLLNIIWGVCIFGILNVFVC